MDSAHSLEAIRLDMPVPSASAQPLLLVHRVTGLRVWASATRILLTKGHLATGGCDVHQGLGLMSRCLA